MSASYNAAVALVAAMPVGLYFGRKASNEDQVEPRIVGVAWRRTIRRCPGTVAGLH